MFFDIETVYIFIYRLEKNNNSNNDNIYRGIKANAWANKTTRNKQKEHYLREYSKRTWQCLRAFHRLAGTEIVYVHA